MEDIHTSQERLSRGRQSSDVCEHALSVRKATELGRAPSGRAECVFRCKTNQFTVSTVTGDECLLPPQHGICIAKFSPQPRARRDDSRYAPRAVSASQGVPCRVAQIRISAGKHTACTPKLIFGQVG